MPDLEQVKKYFSRDRFASLTGIEILQADVGHALCRMPLRDDHMNSNNTTMGGAIFTLADLTFAVAANAAHVDTEIGTVVTQHMSITFLAPPKGTVLQAEANQIRHGRRTCLYEVTVTDELGTKVAHVTGNGFVL